MGIFKMSKNTIQFHVCEGSGRKEEGGRGLSLPRCERKIPKKDKEKKERERERSLKFSKDPWNP